MPVAIKEKGAISMKRSGIITFICIMGFIGAVATIPEIFSGTMKVIDSLFPWYPLCLVLVILAQLVCMVGLWVMKKWSLIIFTMLVVLEILVVLDPVVTITMRITMGITMRMLLTSLGSYLLLLMIRVALIAIAFTKFKNMV
jgi:hypothetical protein